jgi:hypothetical protein
MSVSLKSRRNEEHKFCNALTSLIVAVGAKSKRERERKCRQAGSRRHHETRSGSVNLLVLAWSKQERDKKRRPRTTKKYYTEIASYIKFNFVP